jgi:hypothetical protein
MTIKRLALLLSAALLALAVTAGTASAAVVDANGAYTTSDDTIAATTSSATLTNELIGITCAGTAAGTLDNGDADANTGTNPNAGITAVTFQNCSPVATVAVNDLPYSFTVTSTSLTITSTVTAHIDAVAFTCTAAATPGQIVGDIDWTATTITMDETLDMSGTGCGTTANWTAVYTVTEDLDWQ